MMFSQRIGKTPIKDAFQLETMDNDLRIGLWNCFYQNCLEKIRGEYKVIRTPYYSMFVNLWLNFFKSPIDEFPEVSKVLIVVIRKWFFESEWYDVYDFIESITRIGLPSGTGDFKKSCNIILEKEVSGYRIIDKTIIPITNEQEIREIEEAIKNSQNTKTTGVEIHLKTALSKLSDRKNPDYRNSIKESISAVEAISQVITGDSNATLGAALKIIDGHIELHGALKKGFGAIYGYTSNADGIRHSLLEDSDLDIEDAKYMLISCSAFINYLIVKAEKSGINLK